MNKLKEKIELYKEKSDQISKLEKEIENIGKNTSKFICIKMKDIINKLLNHNTSRSDGWYGPLNYTCDDINVSAYSYKTGEWFSIFSDISEVILEYVADDRKHIILEIYPEYYENIGEEEDEFTYIEKKLFNKFEFQIRWLWMSDQEILDEFIIEDILE